MPRTGLRLMILVFLVGLALTLTLRAQTNTASTRLERPFGAGGKVYLDLSAGAYRIEGSKDAVVRARWRTKDPRDIDRVRARLDAKGSDATLYLSGPGNNFSADIGVPERSDLTLRLSAGDLSIRGIEGNKDVDLWAGDVTIEVGDPQRYRRVDVSVRAGQITAEPFNQTKGGLFRSVDYAGRGSYQLRVRLFAGDLKLVR
jgi:hypothetical protein